MKKFVISLSTATERREHIFREFSKKSINFDFFDALTPEPAAIFAKELNLKINEQSLTKGEVACFMSHVFLWKKMITENRIAVKLHLVFEIAKYLNFETLTSKC